MDIQDICQIAKLIELYGVSIVVLSFFMVVFLGVLLFFMKMNSSLMKSVTELQKGNQITILEFSDRQELAMKELAKSMLSIWEVQDENFNSINKKIKEMENAIETNKVWDIKTYKSQIEKIMILTITEIELFIITKIHTNGLFQYKEVIKEEVSTVISNLIDSGRSKIFDIPYSVEFDTELFKETSVLKKDAVSKILKVLDVGEEYNSTDLFRAIAVIAGDMKVKTSKLLTRMCESKNK